MSETNGAEQLRSQMAQVRSDLTEDVQGLRSKVQDLKDWKGFVRRHPWAVAAGAAALGYLLVPKRPRVIYADAETLAEVAKTQPLRVESPTARGPSVLGSLFRAASSSIVHGLVAMAGRQLGTVASQIMANRVDEYQDNDQDDPQADPPTRSYP